MVELRNEIDTENPAALGWLRQMIPATRELAPGVPVTASTNVLAGLTALTRLKRGIAPERLDVYDYHYYGSPTRAFDAFRRAARLVAPDPLFVGEVGASSAASAGQSVAEGESDQAQWYRVVLAASATTGVRVAPWILHDFTAEAVPFAADPVEFQLGLYRLDGTEKPAAAVVRSAFGGQPHTPFMNGAFAQSVTDGTDTAPLLWTAVNRSGAMTWRAGVGQFGGNVLELAGTRGSSAARPAYFTTVDRAVVPGQVWTVRARVLGTGAAGTSRLSVAWYAADDRWLRNTDSLSLPSGSTGWRAIGVRVAAPAKAASMRIYLSSLQNSGTVRFADVRWTVTTSKGVPIPVQAAAGPVPRNPWPETRAGWRGLTDLSP